MSNKDFKKFLEEIKTDNNKKLMETIIGGYKHLFEAEAGDEDIEVQSASDAPEDTYKEGFETAPEVDIPITDEEATEVPEENPNQVLIDGLNGDLAREYSAAIQYIQHAAMMTGAQYMKIAEEMLVHADEEIEHAKKISDKINYLGGVPTIEVAPIKTSSDSAEMIDQDKSSEEEAIQRYKERIKQAKEAGESGTKQMLMEILVDEEEHKNDLMIALGE
jgi:bacterioferritin